MPAAVAGLIALGLLLCLAMAAGAILTRATADTADRTYTRAVATTGQAAVGIALLLIAHYGYHPAPILRDTVYAAMAAAFIALATRIPTPDS